MKITKSHLKELIKHSLLELDSEKAKKMGLKSKGFGNYVDKSGQHFTTRGGKLHKVDSKDIKKKEKPSLGTSIANKFQKQKDKYDKARKEKPPESTKISAKGMDNPYADKEKRKHISKKDKGTLGKLAKMMGKEKDTMQQPFYKISYTDSKGQKKTDSMRASSPGEAKKDFINMNKGRGFKVTNVQGGEEKKKPFDTTGAAPEIKTILNPKRNDDVSQSEAQDAIKALKDAGHDTSAVEDAFSDLEDARMSSNKTPMGGQETNWKEIQQAETKFIDAVSDTTGIEGPDHGRIRYPGRDRLNKQKLDKSKKKKGFFKNMFGKKESVRESKGRRCTVKEVKKWMRGLEENRYKKTYNSDARRVSWLVNNKLSEDYETMPKSMKKKWPQAAYKRERYLAKEYVKHLKSKFVNELTRLKENKLRKLIREVIKRELNEVRTQKIFVDKKNFKKAHNILKKNKNKIKNVSMVVGNKDSKTSYIQIPYQVYNKALEVLMKNNIKVRG